MSKSIPRKILKVFLWIFGVLFGIVLLVFLLLQIPSVQQRVAREVEKMASASLGAEVGIGHLDIDFPSRVEIDDFYLNNAEGDSIARARHLGVGINMLALIKSKVKITDVVLRDVYANVVTTDSTSNISFLLMQDSTVVDTIVNAADAADTVATSSGFVVDASGAELILERADIFYQDDPAGVLVDVTAERLAGHLFNLNLEKQIYDIDYLELETADILIGISEGSTPPDTTAEAAVMDIRAGRVSIEKSTYRMDMEGQDIDAAIPYANLEGAELLLGEELAFNGELFQLRDFGFQLDSQAPELEGPGIDYNHLALTNVQAEATDIAYIVDSLYLNVRQLSGVEKSGLAITKTEGTVVYDPSYLGLTDFILRTNNSEVLSEQTAVHYDFAGGSVEDATARVVLDGRIGLRDVAYLAPDLLDVPVVGTNLDEQLTFSARANGTMEDLQISRIHVDGPGIKVRGTGRVENAADAGNMSGRLNLAELSIIPGPLLPLVPAGTLPPDIDWPDKIFAEGSAVYRNDRLQLNLYAIENRQFGNGLRSRVKTNGVITGVQSYPNTRLDLSIDTLMATRATILAYVPPGSLPEDYTIPEFVRGSGTVVGPLDDLDVNLRLSLPGDSTYAHIDGNIKNALEPDQLALDLNVSDLALNIGDLEGILPDSMLPANINLPNVRIQDAKISGTLDDLTFDVPLQTDNGVWGINGSYNPRDLDVNLDVEGVRLTELFNGPMADTLARLGLGAVDIQASVTGQLEPTMDLDVAAIVGSDEGTQWLDLTADIADGNYSGEFELTHPELKAVGEGFYVIGPDSVAKVEAVVDVYESDLAYWELTQVPLWLEGRVELQAVGLDPYNMEAFARLDSISIRGEEGSSFIDSLVATASLQNKANEVIIESDVLYAELLGEFDPLKTPQKMIQFIIGYWDEDLDQPNPVEDGEMLDFVFELKRPQPLTSGLINGLTELSPARASLLYRDESPELLMNINLPEVEYYGFNAQDLDFQVVGDTETMGFIAEWSNVEYNDQLQFGRTSLGGETTGEAITMELKMYAENDSLRHYLGLLLDPESDTMLVKLEPEQILNFETWTVPVDNKVMYATAAPALIVNNLVFRNEEQLLAAETTEPNNLQVQFESFDLRTPSRLLVADEEFLGGIVNGQVEVDNLMTSLGIQSDLTITDLAYSGEMVGDIAAKINSTDEQTYDVNVHLTDEGNDATITGSVVLSGEMDLTANLNRVKLTSLEPFSIGYLQESEGYLAGEVNVGGTFTAPKLRGEVRFVDASTIISLLGERFELGRGPILMRGNTVSFSDGWAITDSQGGQAVVSGKAVLGSVDNIELDLKLVARDFLAINSTAEQNEDYYGRMFVDATVDITGTATLPIVDVEATTSRESNITYVYQPADAGLVEAEGVVLFEEQYRWEDIIRQDSVVADTNAVARTGLDLTLNLTVDPELEVTVVVDPVQGQEFTGRAGGDLTLQIFPDGRQEATGRVVVQEGTYDFVYGGVLNWEFMVLDGSSIAFDGDLVNPRVDLKIRYIAEASPLPLVRGVLGASSEAGGLRREQTFYVDVTMEGELMNPVIKTDVIYPEDAYGNLGLNQVSEALSILRQDQSRITTTAFQLLALGQFNIPGIEQGGGGGGNLVANTLTGLMDTYLNNMADDLLGFVELDFGFDNYEDESGQTQTNLRVSLRKTLFDDRVIISVDGVAGTAEDELAGTQQTYLDNITAEYLIDADGSFRIKFFNDRDRSALAGGNVIRYGGRLTFSKDFDRLRWFRKGSKN